MITPQSAKAKGKLLGNYISQEVKKSLDRSAMRQPGSGSGQWKGDVNSKLKILGVWGSRQRSVI